MSRVEEIRRGIAAYDRQQKLILRVLRRHGILSEYEFDRIFTDIKRRSKDGKITRRSRRPFVPLTGETFILGGMYQSYRNVMLELTQCMVAIGLIKTSTVDGLVVYELA